MKSRIPVTVTNVACELFNEAYNKAIKGLYHIKYDCFKEGANYSGYVWAKAQTQCDQPSEIDCLVGQIYQTYAPCSSRSTTSTCEIDFTYTAGVTSCSNVDITINLL